MVRFKNKKPTEVGFIVFLVQSDNPSSLGMIDLVMRDENKNGGLLDAEFFLQIVDVRATFLEVFIFHDRLL